MAECDVPLKRASRSHQMTAARKIPLLKVRLAALSLAAGAVATSSGCAVPAPPSQVDPASTVFVEAQSPLPLYTLTPDGLVELCRAAGLRAAVDSTRGDTLYVRDAWVRSPVVDGPQCARGITAVMLLADLQAPGVVVRRSSPARTAGGILLAVPLTLLAIVALCAATKCISFGT